MTKEQTAQQTTYRLPPSVPWPDVKPDPHAELKAAHAAGKVIQIKGITGADDYDWKDCDPQWAPNREYRIKPCYADEKKTVPLGPEDVPPGSVLSCLEDARFNADLPGEWSSVINTDASKGCLLSGFDARGNPFLLLESWKRLMERLKINRSIPLTGRWDPDAWEPCHKILPQNG